jgi:hypothetical protein
MELSSTQKVLHSVSFSRCSDFSSRQSSLNFFASPIFLRLPRACFSCACLFGWLCFPFCTL